MSRYEVSAVTPDGVTRDKTQPILCRLSQYRRRPDCNLLISAPLKAKSCQDTEGTTMQAIKLVMMMELQLAQVGQRRGEADALSAVTKLSNQIREIHFELM